MNQEIEIEFKNMLTKEEFDLLVNAFNLSGEQFFSQENHYFDTRNFLLKAHKSALRIRKKQGAYTLTLKQPHEKGLLETHQSISEKQAHALFNGNSLNTINGEIKELLTEMEIDPGDILYLGSLTTNRAELKIGDNLLVLDHSIYFSKEDYEVEFEVRDYDKGKQAFLNLLHEHKIPLRPTENKIIRFFKESLR